MAPTNVGKKGKKVVKKGDQRKISPQMVASCRNDPKLYDTHGDPHKNMKVNLYHMINLDMFDGNKPTTRIIINREKITADGSKEMQEDGYYLYDENVSFHPNYDIRGYQCECECEVKSVTNKEKTDIYITLEDGCTL